MFGFPREPARPASRRTTGRVLLVVAATVYFVLGIGYLVLRWAVWPNLELYDVRDITRTGPQFDGRVFRNWAIAWSYQFESGQPLYGEPHRA